LSDEIFDLRHVSAPIPAEDFFRWRNFFLDAGGGIPLFFSVNSSHEQEFAFGLPDGFQPPAPAYGSTASGQERR